MHADLEAAIRKDLLARANRIEAAGDRVTAAAKAGEAPPDSAKEIIKSIAMTIQECQKALDDHSNGSLPLSNETVGCIAHVLQKTHEALSAMILFDAIRNLRP